MKKEVQSPAGMDSLSDIHAAAGLPAPAHPLISLIDAASSQAVISKLPQTHVLKFYKISYKPSLSGKLKYGQAYYDSIRVDCCLPHRTKLLVIIAAVMARHVPSTLC